MAYGCHNLILTCASLQKDDSSSKMTRPIDNERKACDAVARSLETLLSSKRSRPRCPEKEGDTAPIDYAFELSGVTYAIEHTIIEAFERQIHTGVDFAAFTKPIEAALDHRMPSPGFYNLIFPIDPCANLRANNIANMQTTIIAWVTEKAAELHAECPEAPAKARKPHGHKNFRKEVINGFPFELCLNREAGWWMPEKAKGRLLICRYAPKNYEELRKARIEITLNKKLPKLAKWKATGATSILVLENSDLALTNHCIVADTVEEKLVTRPDKPDEVWFVDTTIEHEWTVWRLMSQGKWFPDEEKLTRFHEFNLAGLTAV